MRVVTTRSVLAGLCLALAMLTASACVQVNEAIKSRDLDCREVRDDICVRLADLADAPSRAKFSTIVRIVVRPTDCGDIEDSGMVRRPGMVRCWGSRHGPRAAQALALGTTRTRTAGSSTTAERSAPTDPPEQRHRPVYDARVVTTRTALAGAYLVLAMLTAAACAQLNEAIHPRDLECGEVPDDICTRMANHIVSLWDPASPDARRAGGTTPSAGTTSHPACRSRHPGSDQEALLAARRGRADC